MENENIGEDLQLWMDDNLENKAESHLDAWSERYANYDKEDLMHDLSANHDSSLEIEDAEEELQRELTSEEVDYLVDSFNDKVVELFRPSNEEEEDEEESEDRDDYDAIEDEEDGW